MGVDYLQEAEHDESTKVTKIESFAVVRGLRVSFVFDFS